ncbi:MAG: hypothetical protein SH859_04120 [Hyphomicrobium aestuarii]|nr:hypothetical protein [Hyphomicrobium aestuarii]
MSFDTKSGSAARPTQAEPMQTSPTQATPATETGLSEAPVSTRETDRHHVDDEAPLFELFKPRPDDPKSIRNLRFAVMAMGVILIVLFITVIARVGYLMMRNSPGDARELQSVVARGAVSSPTLPSADASSPIAARATRLVADVKVLLPPSSRVRSHMLSGNRLSVQYEAAAGDGIMIIDLETGQALSHVRLPPSPN